MKKHERSFAEIKNYYNDITHNNLDLIKALKEDVAEMKKREAQNEKLMCVWGLVLPCIEMSRCFGYSGAACSKLQHRAQLLASKVSCRQRLRMHGACRVPALLVVELVCFGVAVPLFVQVRDCC
jgi:hypothetical protein